MYALGFDIGGTKCAAVLGLLQADRCEIVAKDGLKTAEFGHWTAILETLYQKADSLLAANGVEKKDLCGVGISCGGPLDSEKGLILSPPNLPGWDRVPIVERTQAHYGVRTVLCNDADACAVAEWKFGAGKGCRNMIFLTFGTGMGAGLILNGQLYTGASNMAGEVGHLRLASDGPVGYGKAGSFEGFCSGGGLARSAAFYMDAYRRQGMESPLYAHIDKVTAKDLAQAAQCGDAFAIAVMRNCAEKLGQGLSVLIDLLNPERIVIGSIYQRNREFFDAWMLPIVQCETLSHSYAACKIVPAELQENVGDLAALGLVLL